MKELTEGSELSFNTLYNLWASRLYCFAFSYLKSDSAAKDVVQETFVKIWTNRAGINPDHPGWDRIGTGYHDVDVSVTHMFLLSFASFSKETVRSCG